MEQDTSTPVNNVLSPAENVAVTPKKPNNNKIYYLIAGLIVFVLLIIISSVFLLKKQKTAVQNQTASLSNHQNTIQPSQPQISLTQVNLEKITGLPKNTTSLPLGDGKYTTSGPKKGYIYLCHVMQGGGGAQETGNWIHGNTWNDSQKPSVEGAITWPNATFSNTISGSNRIIAGNDLPVGAITGIFPIQKSDPAFAYDRNPNTITAHNFTLTLPLNSTVSSTPSCMGGEVGVMLNGVPLFNGFDAENRDAAAHEVQDTCDGHPQEAGEYHYHSLSSCIKNINATNVIGFALDGFPITGPVLSNGNYLTTNDLDECHGITSTINLDGKNVTMYHYVMTEDFPYSVSCFRGKPVRMQVIQNVSSQNGSQIGQNGQADPQISSKPQPPQEAVTSCSGKSVGSSCSFTAPKGMVNGTCQTPKGGSVTVCVPK